ncbi:MAG: hypothetical protein JRN06_03575 [Nitrososphaerota archaeon]|nr:hypothetical protein [Nitrososphaerota archaeon]MDG7023062.1 hypothetical protein [Nitrososphaerota archaeon]
MEFEKLAVEVSATRAGLAEVRPPVLKGESGALHRFSLLFSDGRCSNALDFYEQATETQVVRSFAKKSDTRSSVGIVCLGGSVTEAAAALARSYGMRIAGLAELESFFTRAPAAPPDGRSRSS